MNKDMMIEMECAVDAVADAIENREKAGWDVDLGLEYAMSFLSDFRFTQYTTVAMTRQAWQKLESLGLLINDDLLSEKGIHLYDQLLRMTRGEECHPELYNGPCWCLTCSSY